jgi:hypothetical protein
MKLTDHNCQSTVGTSKRKERGKNSTNKEVTNTGSKMSIKADTEGTPTNQGPILDNMAPPSIRSNKLGTNKGTLVCFVVKQTPHQICGLPHKKQALQGLDPRLGCPEIPAKAQAHALETRPGQSPNPPHKYAHMAQGERGRTPNRDHSREPSRDNRRSKSAEPGRSPHAPRPASDQAPKQINL